MRDHLNLLVGDRVIALRALALPQTSSAPPFTTHAKNAKRFLIKERSGTGKSRLRLEALASSRLASRWCIVVTSERFLGASPRRRALRASPRRRTRALARRAVQCLCIASLNNLCYNLTMTTNNKV